MSESVRAPRERRHLYRRLPSHDGSRNNRLPYRRLPLPLNHVHNVLRLLGCDRVEGHQTGWTGSDSHYVRYRQHKLVQGPVAQLPKGNIFPVHLTVVLGKDVRRDAQRSRDQKGTDVLLYLLPYFLSIHDRHL